MLEREPSKQARFQAVGRSRDGLKKAIGQKAKDQWNAVPDWPTFALYFESINSVEKLKVLVVQENGAFMWDDRNLAAARSFTGLYVDLKFINVTPSFVCR